MVEHVKQPETQETPKPTTSTDKTTTPTARDHSEETGQAFLQDLGDQYLGPSKPADGPRAKDSAAKDADAPQPGDGDGKKPEQVGERELKPAPKRSSEPDEIIFTDAFGPPTDAPPPPPLPTDAPPAPKPEQRGPALDDRTPPKEPHQREFLKPGEPGGRPRGKDGLPDITELEDKIKEIQMKMALEAAKFIKKEGVEPKAVIADAVKNNNVTFLGEIHTVGVDNPHRKLITETFKDMPKGSRLAIELPENLKPVFDKFNEGKPGSDLEIPDKLDGEFGKEALDLLKLVKEKSPDLIEMWKTARDNGIKINPIDNTSVLMKKDDPRRVVEDAKRDEHMKDKLLAMVKEDPTSHVVAELGGLHAARSQDGKPPKSAADLLTHDPEFKKMDGKIQTIMGQIGQGDGINSALWPATLEMEKPLSVKTKDADGKPNPVGQIPIFSSPGLNSIFGYNMNAYDNVITYPMSAEDLLKGIPKLEGPGGGDRLSDRPGGHGRFEQKPRTEEQYRRDNEEYERQRQPQIEERSRDIKAMKDMKLEPSVKPEQFIDPTPTKSEIETMGVSSEDAAKVKAEVNKNGMTPEKALSDAMKSSRVVGLENPQMDWQQNLEFSMKAFKALKDGGATHAVFNVPDSMKPLIDEFNKTGVVDRTKLNSNANTDYDAASMQAALNNGLKIVAGGYEYPVDNSKSGDRAKVIQDILSSDKDAKVVVVSDPEYLASGNDRHGNPSTVQRLRDAGVTVTTAKVTRPDSFDDRTAVLGRSMKAPVAVPVDKSPALASLKAGIFNELKMSSWDLNIIMPEVKKK